MIQKPEFGTNKEQQLPEAALPPADEVENALGDASKSDLKKGFVAISAENQPASDFPPTNEPVRQEGFLGRPLGWDR